MPYCYRFAAFPVTNVIIFDRSAVIPSRRFDFLVMPERPRKSASSDNPAEENRPFSHASGVHFFSDEMETTMTTLFPCQNLYLDKSMLGNRTRAERFIAMVQIYIRSRCPSCCSEAAVALNRQVPAAETDAPATRKRSGRARGRARLYTALAMLVVGFATVAPSRAGLPTVGASAAADSAAGESASRDSATGDSVKPQSVRPAEAGTQEAPQDRRSRPAHSSSHANHASPHRNARPPVGNATAQLNHQEAARHQAAPPPHGIHNFFSMLFR
jgi:hypothetical protein